MRSPGGPDGDGPDTAPPLPDGWPSGSRIRLDVPSPWADLPPASRRGIGIETIRHAFTRRTGPPDVPGRPGARKAAVLVALFEEVGDTRILLIERSETVGTHRGEIAFPGGERDIGEETGPAALREAWEEIGLDPAVVELIGELERCNANATNFQITPVVGVLAARPALRVNHSEVQQVFDVPLAELMVDGVYREECWTVADVPFTVPFFDLPKGSVWGVTAMMLLDLLQIVTGKAYRPAPVRV